VALVFVRPDIWPGFVASGPRLPDPRQKEKVARLNGLQAFQVVPGFRFGPAPYSYYPGKIGVPKASCTTRPPQPALKIQPPASNAARGATFDPVAWSFKYFLCCF
jgi:hypothetical protein